MPKDDKRVQEKKHLTPYEYFNDIKNRRNKNTDKGLDAAYQTCAHLLEKQLKTGQLELAKRNFFLIENIEKEKKLLDLGIDTFVYRDDIIEFVEEVEAGVVKLIELENYERDIPDDIVEIIEKTKGLFQQYYVVFTDYAGKVEKKVERKHREKDPILFGAFIKEESSGLNRTLIMSERLYYLGDWVDDFCDLTFEKMVDTMKEKRGKDIVMKIVTPQDVDEFNQELIRLDKEVSQKVLGERANNPRQKKESFFKKITSLWKK